MQTRREGAVSRRGTAAARVVDPPAATALRPDGARGAPRALVEPPPGVLQRILLTTDGSVGRILEVYADEPIEVVKLAQWSGPAGEDNAALALTTEDEALRRRVILRGSGSGRSFVYADALIALDRLHPTVRSGLISTSASIGKLLTTVRAETLREILSSGVERAGSIAAHFGIEEDDELFVRSYRIIAGGHPIMLITEKFPTSWFLP